MNAKMQINPTIETLCALVALACVVVSADKIDIGDVNFVGSRANAGVEDSIRHEAALKQAEQITVIAPKYLRPQSDYHVLLNLANSKVPATIDLQLIGARDSNREQTEAKSVIANSGETQTVKFSIGDWPSAEYVLQVNAQAVDRSWNFTDEKQLIYQAKSYSGFIQTDKAIYKPGQLVQFRALFLTPTLTPLVLKNAINATITDPRDNIIKQWQELSSYRGLVTLDMPLSADPMLGDYTIKFEARGQEFTKKFTVAEYVLPTFDVTIELPKYATYKESDIVAIVKARYTYGKPVQGHVTLTVQPLVRFQQISTRPLSESQHRSRLGPDGTAEILVDIVKDLRLDANELFEREIEFFALVEEDLTGRKYNRTQSLKIYRNSIKIERLHERSTYKPGMETHLQYKVAYQDDIPVEDNGPEVELKYSALGRPIGRPVRLRPWNGLIDHKLSVPLRVPSPQSDEIDVLPGQLEIEAVYRGQIHQLPSMKAYHSKSQQYIQIILPQVHSLAARGKRKGGASLQIDDELKIEVNATEPLQQVTCQGFARGDIVWALSRNVANQTKFNFDVKLEQRMAPEMRILCFHIRQENKELIADSTQVSVGGLSKNLVKLVPNRDEAKPGQEVEIGVFTKPNAFVGVLAVDQSVLLLKSGNDLDREEVFNDVKSYGSSVESSTNEFDMRSSGDNAESLFDLADMVVMSNNLIYNGFGSRLGRPVYSPNILQFMSANPAPSSKIVLESLILDHELPPPTFHLSGSGSREPLRIRSEFPETWLWQNMTANDMGQAQISAKAPDTITSWELSAFSLSESHGLALSSDRTSIRVFRPFFIKLNLPYSIIRGETVSIQAIVFNYSKRPLVARVTLDNKAREFEFVEAANTIDDERHSFTTSETRLVSIPSDSSVSVSFLVRPVKLGNVDVRVLAQSDTLGDGISKKLLVKPEGQTQFLNKAMLIQLNGPGQTTWRRNVSIEVPANAVEGSQKVSVSAIGDILGAGLSHVDDLLRLPYGCGEQNMINLVPNIAIFNYLQSSRRLRDNQRDRATRNIETGYQRQLNYKRSDGSFSAFGSSDSNGSVWLTAYVLKTFQQAKAIISVDERVVQQAANFIASNSRADGSIAEVGMLHNKALASEIATGEHSIYLTAYSMIALIQKPITLSQAAGGQQQLDEVIERGLDYLAKHVERINTKDPKAAYELAIVAYALHLAGSSRQSAADRAYEQLWAMANELDDKIWWSGTQGDSQVRKPSAESDVPKASGADDEAREYESSDGESPTSVSAPRRTAARLTATQPPLKSVGVKGDQSAHLLMPNSLDVEATAWALLTASRRQDLDRALLIVRWLVSHQNARGGYASTQDTVLAVEALSSFAEASATSRAPLSIDVEFIYPRLSSSTGAPLRRTNLDQVIISQTNALVQQQTRLPDNITWVQVQATGTGLAVVQVSWQYNLLVSAERPAFYLNPIIDRSSTVNYLQLSICTFYKGAGEASNMAVVEVELPSGYVADAETLPSLKRNTRIKRVDSDNGETRVIVYLDRVTRAELCFTVPAHRSTKVSNNKPVPVTIYDYYDRRQAARIFYEPLAASSCDICDSDECRKQCAESKPKHSDRLVSMRELRVQREKQQRESSTATHRANLISEHAPDRPTSSGGNLTLPSKAADYLPLSSAFMTLMSAIKTLP